MVAYRQHRRSFDGFTLIELVMVVAIASLLVTAGAVAARRLMKTELRSAASRTAATIQFAFDRAAMNGAYYRLAFNLDQGEIWLEESEDRVSLRQGDEQQTTTEKKSSTEKSSASKMPSLSALGLGGGNEDESSEEDVAPTIDLEGFKKQHEEDLKPVESAKAHFQPYRGVGAEKKLKFHKRVHIESVMTPRLEEPVTKGTAYLYFFPQGHAEPAIVRLKSDEEAFFSIVLHPLTGQAKIYPCAYRIPEEFGEQDDLSSNTRRGDPCE